MALVHVKDPQSILDYSEDFTDWLEEGDSIATHDVAVEAGDVVVDSTDVADGVVTAILSGGTVFTRARVRYRVTSTAGFRDDRSKDFYISNL